MLPAARKVLQRNGVWKRSGALKKNPSWQEQGTSTALVPSLFLFAVLSPGGLSRNRLSGFNHRFIFFFMAQHRLFFPQSKPLAPRPGFSNYWFSTFPTGEGVACRSAGFRTTQTFSLLPMRHSSFLFRLLRFFAYNCSRLPISASPRPCHGAICRASLCPHPLFCSHLALASISLLPSPEKPV